MTNQNKELEDFRESAKSDLTRILHCLESSIKEGKNYTEYERRYCWIEQTMVDKYRPVIDDITGVVRDHFIPLQEEPAHNEWDCCPDCKRPWKFHTNAGDAILCPIVGKFEPEERGDGVAVVKDAEGKTEQVVRVRNIVSDPIRYEVEGPAKTDRIESAEALIQEDE